MIYSMNESSILASKRGSKAFDFEIIQRRSF